MHFQSESGLIWEYPWTELQEWGHDLKLVGLGLGDLRRGKADQKGMLWKILSRRARVGLFRLLDLVNRHPLRGSSMRFMELMVSLKADIREALDT